MVGKLLWLAVAWRHWLWRGFLTVAAATVLGLGLLMLFEDRFIFFPEAYPSGDWDAPTRAGVAYEDVWLTTGDGVRVHGWWLPAPGGDANSGSRWTVLFFHGNAGNLSGRFFWTRALARLPADVFIIDYRGYGRSEGSPDEDGVYQDADAAWRHLVEERKVPPERLVLYGNSLGGGVASWLATHRACGALVLANTFTSIPEMASRQLPFVPRALVRTQMNTRERLGELEVPVFILHSRGDRMIPVKMARENLAAANEPKRLLELDGADHNEVSVRHGDRIIVALRAFLSEVGR